MDIEFYKDEFRKERRARLAAERLLEQKQSQLTSANRKLSQHTINLSGQIVDQRKVLDKLQGETSEATAQSLKANHKALAAERLLWDAVTSIQDGFALFDKNRKLISANAPYLDLFRPAQNVGPGISMESILDLCLEADLIDRDSRSEDEWYDFMLDRLGEDDIKPITLKLHNGVYVKLLDRHTTDGGIVSLALNITDTIRREEELLKARDTALAADRAKSAFLAKMSHEFRTPINGVVGMADLMLDRATDEDSLLYANTIKSSGQSLLGFVDNILDYALIDADRLTLNTNPFDFNDVLEKVQATTGFEDLSDKVKVRFDTDPTIPPDLIGDSKRIGQIIKNLYSNALKNTVSGTVIVRSNWEQTNKGTQLTVAVEDTGAGIPEDKLDHIFVGFNQSDDSQTRDQDGAGLGLSIAQKLVETMGGKLSIKSVEGEGSQFGIALPISSSTSVEAIDESLPKKLRVLAAEDNKTNQLVFQKMLSDADIDLKMVANGIEAVDAFKTFEPHLIFMDISMPKMDGMEATQQIRWHEVETGIDPIPIVAMTAHAMEGDEARIRNCGLDHYMTKPLSKAAILEMITTTSENLEPPKLQQKVS